MKSNFQNLPGLVENLEDRITTTPSQQQRLYSTSLSTPSSSSLFQKSSMKQSPKSLIRSNSMIRFTMNSLSLDNNHHHISSDHSSDDDDYSADENIGPTTSGTLNINFEKDDLFVLMPFNHQVGGHTQMMLLNQDTLCKPLIPRELLFYLNIPHQLHRFVPTYKGVVEIRQNESSIPTLYHPLKHSEKKPELRLRLSFCDDRSLLEQNQAMGYISSRPNQQYFMLLENIASKYHLPCVLDLKMGTRQHSDDASEEKRHRQMAKCAASTSGTLGLRICGMQTYHKISSNTYKLHQRDKYHGRRIKNEDGLKTELEIYFKDRIYHIRPIISKLKKLKTKIVETYRTSSIRFCSTSLLIVTEGCLDSHQVRFGPKHYTYSDGEEDFEDEDYEDSDEEDFNFDVLRQTDSISKNRSIPDDDSSSSLDTSISDESLINSNMNIPYDDNVYNCNRDHRPSHRSPSSSSKNIPEGFDIRLIDFAHTSFDSSSDYGFILGLDNLIRILNEILFDKIRSPMVDPTTTTLIQNSSDIYQINFKRRRSSSINIDCQLINNNNSMVDTHHPDDHHLKKKCSKIELDENAFFNHLQNNNLTETEIK